MKQALNRLALYCAAKSMSLYVTGDGFAIGPRSGGGAFAQVIPVAELADRVEALNSAPVATEDGSVRMGQAAIRTLVAMGYEWNSGNRFWMPPPKSTEAAPAPAAIPDARVLAAPGYDGLADVLHRAFHQAASGKGKERHASAGIPFEQQPMTTINELLGSVDGYLYQAMKKATEARRLPAGRDVAELLGAINYLAGAVLQLERHHADRNQAANDPAISAQRHA